MLQCEAKLHKNHRTTTESELTYLWCTLASEVSGRGRMGGVELVVLALSCERLGVLAVSTKLLAIKYPPVLLPLSRPHDGFSGEWRGGRIASLPVELLHVRIDARVDAWVCVGLWWSRRVVSPVSNGRRLTGLRELRIEYENKVLYTCSPTGSTVGAARRRLAAK